MDTGLLGPQFGLFRGDVAESGMERLSIIVAFDVGEQVPLGGLARGIVLLMDEFGLQASQATSGMGSSAFFRCRRL